MMYLGQRSFLGLILSEFGAAWRMRGVRRALYILVPIVCVFSIGFWWALAHVLRLYHSCSDRNSQVFLDTLCDMYLDGKVTGSLCESLCVTREIQFRRCLGHGNKLHVLEAEWNAYTIVLKAPHKIGSKRALEHVRLDTAHVELTREQFVQKANESIFFNVAGRRHAEATVKVAEQIFVECDLLENEVLQQGEAVACWELVETHEYVLYSLLQGRVGIPDVYGTCGHMYAVQYAPSKPYLGRESSLSDQRSWDFRARLALGLLEMVESIEDTPLGTLYLCDVQEPNFGVVRREDRLVAKAIDTDISFFQNHLESMIKNEVNKSCARDSDCDFINCEIPCSTATGKCAGKLNSNNLQLLCKRIMSKQYPLHAALLSNPPQEFQAELDAVLDKCVTPGSIHIPLEILHELRSVLLRSIHS